MRNKKRTIELANLVVLFGTKGLLEKFKNSFFPVLDGGRVKGKGEVISYRFHNLKVDSIDKTPVLYGQLLKFMNIEAEQDYDEEKGLLVDSKVQMASVPSSFFVVDLSTHRISYLGETRRSPTLKDFEYCIKRLLKADWAQKRKAMKEQILEEKGKVRMTKDIREEVESRIEKALPSPNVRVTPLPAIKKLGSTLDPFKVITQVSIKPMLRNNELSDENAKFLRSLEKQQDKLKSKRTTLNVSNPVDGLKKTEVKKLVKQASSGNYEVKVKGKDSAGEDIDSNLRDVSVKFKEVIPARESGEARAKRLLDKMRNAFQRGYVLAVTTSEDVLKEAKAIVSALKK